MRTGLALSLYSRVFIQKTVLQKCDEAGGFFQQVRWALRPEFDSRYIIECLHKASRACVSAAYMSQVFAIEPTFYTFGRSCSGNFLKVRACVSLLNKSERDICDQHCKAFQPPGYFSGCQQEA